MSTRITVLTLLLVSGLFAQPGDYFQQDVYYTIDITLNPITHKYHGQQKLIYTNNSPDELEYIWFHLYPNAYKDESTPYAKQQKHMYRRPFHYSDEKDRGYINLTSVKANGLEISWQYKEDAIDEAKLLLDKPLKPGETITIELDFNAQFPIVFSRSGHWGERYFHGTQWYPKVVVYDKYGWHPDSYVEVGEFYGEFGTFDVSITLPKNFVIDATGMLQENPFEEAFLDSIIEQSKKLTKIKDVEERNKFWQSWQKSHRNNTNYDSLKTVRFVAENVHDFAWFAGEDFMIHQKITQDNVLARVLTLPQNAYDWKDVPDWIDKTLWFYGDKVGKYKYPKATVVDGSHETSGGMEYPMITLITMDYQSWTNMLEMVIAHEVGHNWFQGMIGNNERASVFLDEGLNDYHEVAYMNHYYGFYNLTKFDSLLGSWNILDDLGEWHYHNLVYGSMARQHKEQPMSLRGEQFTRNSYSSSNYSKAGFMLNALKWMMGEKEFEEAIKTYFERWHFKHPGLDDFWNTMQEYTKEDINHFRKEWMETTHYNDFELEDYETSKSGSEFTTKVFVSNQGTIKGLPAPVHLVTAQNDTLEGRWSGNESDPVIFKHFSPVENVEVNLKRLFFETDYYNNSNFPEFEFAFLRPIPSFDKYKVTFYPYLGYEYFKDGTRLGTGFWSGNPIFNHYFFKGNAYYALESGNIGYSLKLDHRLPGFILNYSDVYLGIEDKDGLKNIDAKLKMVYRNPNSFAVRYNIQLGLSNIKLHDMIYHEPGIYQKSRYTSAKIEFNSRLRRMVYWADLNIRFEKSIDVLNSQADFFKFEIKEKFTFFLTKKVRSKLDVYIGSVTGDNVPSQELIFAGGDVDPKHEAFVPGYRGSAAPIRSYTLEKGMGMLGHGHQKGNYLKNKSGFAVGIEFDVPIIPTIYGRAGTMASSFNTLGDDKYFFESGFKIDSGFLSLTFPMYISDPIPGEENFEFRTFFNLESPINFD
ncbi:MAG: M1 family peptidase [Calditrichaeota bacterium]|nr:MAG: M1 family peptidase [Calditrichota bacterium]MBL1207641.1 M1 family peptidase [Calditrichota bacterium]NOG47474.1 M1 family metallopeptidase [Calditrichota bacterium]